LAAAIKTSHIWQRECNIQLTRGQYTQLAWYAWDAANNLSYGYLDFE